MCSCTWNFKDSSISLEQTSLDAPATWPARVVNWCALTKNKRHRVSALQHMPAGTFEHHALLLHALSWFTSAFHIVERGSWQGGHFPRVSTLAGLDYDCYFDSDIHMYIFIICIFFCAQTD